MYESWNPTELMTSGLMASWIVRAVSRTLTGDLFLPSSLAVSLIVMNRNALMIYGAAPVLTE